MKNNINSDITGLASLDPVYQMKAQQFAHLPDDDNKIDMLMKSGLDFRTAGLVMKARALQEANEKSATTRQPVNPNTVAQDIDTELAHYEMMHPQIAAQGKGIASVPVPENMFNGNYAKGGIVAFSPGGLNDPDTAAGMLGQPQPQLTLDQMRSEAPSTPAGVDPVRVNTWMTNAFKIPSPLDVAVSGVSNMGYNPETYLKQIRDDRANAASVAEQLRPVGNEEDYIRRAKDFAVNEAGMNKGEANSLLALSKYRDDMNEYYANDPVTQRSLSKSSGDLQNAALEAFKNRMPLSNTQGVLMALGIVGKNQINAASEAQKAQYDAHLDTAIKEGALQEAMAKNLISARTEGTKEFHDAYMGWNDAAKRQDELDKTIETAQTNALAHGQQLRASATLAAAGYRQPGVTYQPKLDYLAQARAEALARGPDGAADVAAIDVATKNIQDLRQQAVGATTQGYSAGLSAVAKEQVAKFMTASREHVAAMSDRELFKLETDLAQLPDLSDNPMLQGMRGQLTKSIADRKAQLGMGGAGSSATAPRRITVSGVEKIG